MNSKVDILLKSQILGFSYLGKVLNEKKGRKLTQTKKRFIQVSERRKEIKAELVFKLMYLASIKYFERYTDENNAKQIDIFW